MRHSSTYRAERRNVAKAFGNEMSRMDTEVGPGRRTQWLIRHPKVANYYAAALSILQPKGLGQRPSWRAIRKTMVALAAAPRIQPVGVPQPIPYQYMQAPHERGSWRDWPRVAINANLKIADV